ncbi:palmitoleoyl-protein carboxylesterase notum1 isoform X2 [Pseudomyrmex gracilis]|uniref:palmitoleoyl-protein carboxylesterase notum1 isoform X2 n=1 Tax=Pseudomyrmex gracilis TaxID=219809 RepID=UPI00099560CD|nr:palmitoleoyl-protein carboxylesterase notum1 isoform X2 [Pseudomyrmex gracilis]
MKTTFQITLYLTTLILMIVAEDKPNTVSVSPGSPSTELKSNTIQKLITILGNFGLDDQRGLKKVYLSNRTITCNDGSQAGFYLRKSHGSKRWIMFLDGGWYCYDNRTCRSRWMRARHLMTSTQWPETRDVGGILSMHPNENPHFWLANHVFVPYCTSDIWSGSSRGRDGMFSFMGAEIVTQVIRDLVPLGLESANSFLLSGSSAGGTGVMLNLNRVHHLIHRELGLRHIAIHGVSDSGWFLDDLPAFQNGMSPVDAIKKGMELWQSRMPNSCVIKYPNESWRCFFGHRIYSTLSAPLFVFQWIFDETPIMAYNIPTPVTKQRWDHIHKMGDNVRQSLENVSAAFAPSCISHSVLTIKDWKMVKIDDYSFAHALHCWDEMLTANYHSNDTPSQIETNQPCRKPLKQLLRSGASKENGTAIENGKSKAESLTEMQKARSTVAGKTRERKPASGSIQEQENKKKRKRKHKGRKRKERQRNKEARRGRRKKHERRKGNRRGEKQLNDNHTFMFNGTKSNTKPNTKQQIISSGKWKCHEDCRFHIVERCTWPQCNHSCPKLHNPFTGEEMDLIELLKSFGLEMASVANALGVDIHTLNSMDHDELLTLLTRTAT